MQVCFDQFNTIRSTTVPVRSYNELPATNTKHCLFYPKCNLLNEPLFLSNVNRLVRPCYRIFDHEPQDFLTKIGPSIQRLQQKVDHIETLIVKDTTRHFQRSLAIIQQHVPDFVFEDSIPLQPIDAGDSL